MKKVIVSTILVLSATVFIRCNDSGKGNSGPDSTIRQHDTIKAPIVTEGGLQDSLRIGASDSSAAKKND